MLLENIKKLKFNSFSYKKIFLLFTLTFGIGCNSNGISQTLLKPNNYGKSNFSRGSSSNISSGSRGGSSGGGSRGGSSGGGSRGGGID